MMTKHALVAILLLVAAVPVAQSSGYGKPERRARLAIRPGDFLLISMPCYACSLIEKTTGSSYSHVAIVDSVGAEDATLLMAVEPRAARVSLRFIQENTVGRPQKFVRLRSISASELAAALERARGFVGTPFDSDFLPGAERLYCSELVHYAFQRADGTPLFPFRPMRFGLHAAEWTKLLGHAPPEGELGLSPADLERSPLLEDVR